MAAVAGARGTGAGIGASRTTRRGLLLLPSPRASLRCVQGRELQGGGEVLDESRSWCLATVARLQCRC
eukprot:10143771-Alexandrium_andersonii.AAC.1